MRRDEGSVLEAPGGSVCWAVLMLDWRALDVRDFLSPRSYRKKISSSGRDYPPEMTVIGYRSSGTLVHAHFNRPLTIRNDSGGLLSTQCMVGISTLSESEFR